MIKRLKKQLINSYYWVDATFKNNNGHLSDFTYFHYINEMFTFLNKGKAIDLLLLNELFLMTQKLNNNQSESVASLLHKACLFSSKNHSIYPQQVNELNINSLAMPLVTPLALYSVRYGKSYRNYLKVFNDIDIISSQITSHPRGIVASIFIHNFMVAVINYRRQNKRILLFKETKILLKDAIKLTFDMLKVHHKYYQELRYFALLERNNRHVVHLQKVTFEQLNSSDYVVDTLLNTFWFLFHIKTIKHLKRKLIYFQKKPLTILSVALFCLLYDGNF